MKLKTRMDRTWHNQLYNYDDMSIIHITDNVKYYVSIHRDMHKVL